MGSDMDPNANLDNNPRPHMGHMGAPMPRVCGGCAFSDAAAMSAMVTKLQAELAQAKVALQDKAAAEAALQQHKRDLEAAVLSLRSEVSLILPEFFCSCSLQGHLCSSIALEVYLTGQTPYSTTKAQFCRQQLVAEGKT